MLTKKPRFPVKSILLHGWLPSPLKKAYYRLKGYKVGHGVKLGFGSVIEGENVAIGEDSNLGFFTIVRGRSISLGKRVSIGAMSILDTPELEVGNDTKINEQVFVGGLQNPDSSLKIGYNCQIQQWTFINPFKRITIGHDTSIGGHSLIFSHHSWLNIFDGYMADFRPIEIGNNVGIAWRVFIGAGSKIGDGSLVGANSLVNRTIPSKSLAMGTPAKVVAKAPVFPRNVSADEKVGMLTQIMGDFQEFLIGHEFQCESSENFRTIKVHRKNGSSDSGWTMEVCFEPEECSESEISEKGLDVYLSLCSISEKTRLAFDSGNTLWLDIQKGQRANFSNDFGEEVVNYLKRYGVRFTRECE